MRVISETSRARRHDTLDGSEPGGTGQASVLSSRRAVRLREAWLFASHVSWICSCASVAHTDVVCHCCHRSLQNSDWSFIDVWRRSSSLPWRSCGPAQRLAAVARLGAERRSRARVGLRHRQQPPGRPLRARPAQNDEVHRHRLEGSEPSCSSRSAHSSTNGVTNSASRAIRWSRSMGWRPWLSRRAGARRMLL